MRRYLLAVSACVGLAVSPAAAQDRDQVGLAIVQACGQVDESRVGVLTGTVRDALTGVPLNGATISIMWQESRSGAPRTETLRTDSEGFYLKCDAPGGRTVQVGAEVLGRASESRTVEIEAGNLLVEHFEIEVSDPTAPGFVTGRVVDNSTRGPVANAEIRVRDTEITTLSNAGGMFVLEEMPYGIYVLEVDHLAYESREIPLRVAGGLTQNVMIELSEEAVEIEGLTVSVEPRRFYNAMDGLVQRMELGFGDFLTRTDIERSTASTLPQLLQGIPGVRLWDNGRSLVIRNTQCTPFVFMDGRPYRLDEDMGLREILAYDIEAVEFYKGTAAIPAEFNYSTNGQIGCGAIIVWTRRGR